MLQEEQLLLSGFFCGNETGNRFSSGEKDLKALLLYGQSLYKSTIFPREKKIPACLSFNKTGKPNEINAYRFLQKEFNRYSNLPI
jgi:hypothetical protein